MPINSPLFFFFLSLFLFIYILLYGNNRARVLFLVAGSIAFLVPTHLISALVLLAFISISYLFAYALDHVSKHRKKVFVAAICFHVALLIGFRVYGIYGGSNPLGLSFYALASITYLVDLYYRRVNVAPIGTYGAAVSFFPILVSGPIVRLKDLIEQVGGAVVPLDSERVLLGVLLIANGLFKKSIADFSDLLAWDLHLRMPWASGLFSWLIAINFTAKYYADFSGYSDIAIGCCALLGVRLPINFNLPFLSVSIGDFWRRWHISFNEWIRQFIFQPLTFSSAFSWMLKVPFIGERLFYSRHYAALIMTMVAAGAWHGFTLNFVAWGLYMGIWLAVDMAVGAEVERLLPKALRMFLTFLIVVNGFVIFMGESLRAAMASFSRMYHFSPKNFDWGLSYLLGVGLVLVIPHFLDYTLINVEYFRGRKPWALAAIVLLFLAHYLWGGFKGAPFAYSRF